MEDDFSNGAAAAICAMVVAIGIITVTSYTVEYNIVDECIYYGKFESGDKSYECKLLGEDG